MMCIHDHPAVHPLSTEQLQTIPTYPNNLSQLGSSTKFSWKPSGETTGTGFTPPLALSHQSNEKHVGRRENPQPPQTMDAMDIPIYPPVYSNMAGKSFKMELYGVVQLRKSTINGRRWSPLSIHGKNRRIRTEGWGWLRSPTTWQGTRANHSGANKLWRPVNSDPTILWSYATGLLVPWVGEVGVDYVLPSITHTYTHTLYDFKSGSLLP